MDNPVSDHHREDFSDLKITNKIGLFFGHLGKPFVLSLVFDRETICTQFGFWSGNHLYSVWFLAGKPFVLSLVRSTIVRCLFDILLNL